MIRRDRPMDEPTFVKIVKMVTANPRIGLKELAKATGIENTSNIHYHIRRLEKQGKIKWMGSVRPRGPQSNERKQSRWDKGLVALPKMTQAEREKRIDAIVKKALEKDAFRQDHDLIHDYRACFNGHPFKAHKI